MRSMPAATPRLLIGTPSAPIARWLVPVAALVLLGCGLGPNERSGGDSGRGDAAEAPMDTLMYDRVSVDEGDSTDWKSFKLEEDAPVLIQVWWDDPKAVNASVELYDAGANSLGKLKHKRGQPAEKLGPTKLGEGTYYVKFHASGGASVYSYKFLIGTGDPKDVLPDL